MCTYRLLTSNYVRINYINYQDYVVKVVNKLYAINTQISVGKILAAAAAAGYTQLASARNVPTRRSACYVCANVDQTSQQ